MIDTDSAIHANETKALQALFSKLSDGRGHIVLVSGEAGVGVTTCIENALANDRLRILRGRASEMHKQPFNPIIQTLRAYLRSNGKALAACEAFEDYLAILLPELGDAPENSDQATLFEAIRDRSVIGKICHRDKLTPSEGQN